MNGIAEIGRSDGEPERKRGAIQVICLGSGGGPSEDNVTGLLVRSTSTDWARGSILAVDAGSHLAAITRILEKQLPLVYQGTERANSNPSISHQQHLANERSYGPDSSPSASPPPAPLEPVILQSGPFAGLPLPHASARANAAHIVRSQVSTYLITHPHLDHLSGFAINTAAFHATSRPKTLAALPFTVNAIKQHIFNDVIWPNLTDEDGGVGFVTFQRLKEGGDVMVGEGEGRGYIEVCDGLGAKGFKISHGKCMKSGQGDTHHDSIENMHAMTPMQRRESRQMSFQSFQPPDRGKPDTPTQSLHSPSAVQPPHSFSHHNSDVVGSTAYFIRDVASSREVLIFGDVEPDSISICPRLAQVWITAAPKIASGILTGIFIECSYDDSQADAVLFGHLAPRHLIAELQTLADLVREEKALQAQEKAMRKRKRMASANGTSNWASDEPSGYADKKRSRSLANIATQLPSRRGSVPEALLREIPESPASPHHHATADHTPSNTPVRFQSTSAVEFTTPDAPLQGVKVIIIHIKDTLKDGPHISENILEQLDGHAAVLAKRGEQLGCEFVISESGQDYMF